MIIVAVGTQKFQMKRLVEKMDAIAAGLHEEVFIQIGHTVYTTKNCTCRPFVDAEEFQTMIEQCSLLITHAGVGTIMRGIKANRPVIVVPRLSKYGEHVDDHQVQIAKALEEKQCVLMCEEIDQLPELIEKARVTTFQPYLEPKSRVEDLIRNYLEMNTKGKYMSNMPRVKKQLTLYSNNSQVMNDAVDRIVVELHNKPKQAEGARKILLTGCSTQCGTTSTCISLAISLADAKWRTLLIDCDIRKAFDMKKLNENTGKGLADCLLDEDMEQGRRFEDIIYETNFENLSYIPCGRYAANPARLFCSKMMEELLEYMNQRYDYIIFDFPSITVSSDAEILFGKMDGIVLLSSLDGVTKSQIRDAKRKIKPYQDRYYGMIINQVDAELYRRYIKYYDYYFLDWEGNQRLSGNLSKRYNRLKKIAEREESRS